jgi:hypothetical protein
MGKGEARVQMSRLIAVGVVRTACGQLQDQRGRDWERVFGQCKPHLQKAVRYQRKAFEEELGQEIRKWNLAFSVEQVGKFVTASAP